MPSSMFQKKLAGAQSRQSQKRKRVFGYSALAIFVALLTGVFAYLVVQIDSAWTKLQEAEESRLQGSGINAASNIAAPPQSKTTEATQPTNNVAVSTEAQVFREQSLIGTSSISLVQDSRRQFMQQLAQYENEIEPKINEIQLNNWDGEKHAELNQLKARAIEHFSKGEYLLAREGLQQVRAMAAMAAAEYVSRLATAKREANEAFENNRALEAGKAIQQALRLSPDDSEMLALQKRVGVLSQVLDLLKQADVAQNENRPEKEVVALQKILSIDRSRGQIKSRLQKLRAQLKQQQFSSVLSKVQSALDAGNLADAKKQIAMAKTIFPASNALWPLQNRLQQIQTEREFAEQISRGEQAVQRDDWPAAAKSFGHARQLKPNNKTAIENHNSAQQVVNSTQQIGMMLVHEHRLGDKNIVNSVAAYLGEVEPVAGLSPKLQKIHAELARKVELYKTEVDVVVVSDNKTYIVVRGEGQVGKTARRTIRLRPGKRVFEGSRVGYKSKLVTLDIKPGMPPLEVTIVCDEKI